MKKTISHPVVLLVDDEDEILFSTSVILRKAGLNNLESIGDSRRVLPFLADKEAGVIVLDLQMPHISGKVLLTEITGNYPHIPVIIMTAANDLNTAVDCMKSGAFDYIVKPIEPSKFVSCIRKALEINALRSEISFLRESLLSGQLRHEAAFAAFTTRSSHMKSMFGYIEALAGTAQPVLVTGETGVGKELVARAIHGLSRRKGEFIAVNTGALDDFTFSDTLFGHHKGAFTGADQTREGIVAKAAGGTLFLDEIGEMPLPSQVKLLRLLQEGEYYPLGSDVARLGNARIVVATNRNLETQISQGLFRKDLYYRLCTHHVEVPPLRERPEDIPLLLEVFLDEAARSMGRKTPAYPPELIAYLSTYYFPGNIRELRSMVIDAVTRHKGGVLSMSVFQNYHGKNTSSPGKTECQLQGEPEQLLKLPGRLPTLKEAEESIIREALKRANGNQGAAATLLGISRQALNKRLRKK